MLSGYCLMAWGSAEAMVEHYIAHAGRDNSKPTFPPEHRSRFQVLSAVYDDGSRVILLNIGGVGTFYSAVSKAVESPEFYSHVVQSGRDVCDDPACEDNGLVEMGWDNSKQMIGYYIDGAKRGGKPSYHPGTVGRFNIFGAVDVDGERELLEGSGRFCAFYDAVRFALSQPRFYVQSVQSEHEFSDDPLDGDNGLVEKVFSEDTFRGLSEHEISGSYAGIWCG